VVLVQLADRAIAEVLEITALNEAAAAAVKRLVVEAVAALLTAEAEAHGWMELLAQVAVAVALTTQVGVLAVLVVVAEAEEMT
jgi:Arc/MetJ family transcription regulator